MKIRRIPPVLAGGLCVAIAYLPLLLLASAPHARHALPTRYVLLVFILAVPFAGTLYWLADRLGVLRAANDTPHILPPTSCPPEFIPDATVARVAALLRATREACFAAFLTGQAFFLIAMCLSEPDDLIRMSPELLRVLPGTLAWHLAVHAALAVLIATIARRRLSLSSSQLLASGFGLAAGLDCASLSPAASVPWYPVPPPLLVPGLDALSGHFTPLWVLSSILWAMIVFRRNCAVPNASAA